jgi:L-serine dehydratase
VNIFDILGPVMVGPSSSHTAGAVRIGYVARRLLKDSPVYVDIGLYGSFAATGKGHGTDKALVAGLLGMAPDDSRIPESLNLARRDGLKVFFSEIATLSDAHPNTAVLNIQGKKGRKLSVQASSIGGGRIMINKIDGITVNFSGETSTLIVHNYDTPGHVAQVTNLLYKNNINIASMNLYRVSRGSYAVMVLETDQKISSDIVNTLENISGVIKVTYFDGEK